MKPLWVILAFLMLCGVASAGLETQYTYNWTHYINGSSAGTLTNYPITLLLFNGTGNSSGENFYLGGSYVNANWSDVAFSQDGTTALPMWLETASSNATSARFWVNMSSITGGLTNQTPLYIYFGNASATSLSNINTTFPFGDDFNEATLNTSKWTTSGNVTLTTSEVVCEVASGVSARIDTTSNISVNKSIRTRIKGAHINTTSYVESFQFYSAGDDRISVFTTGTGFDLSKSSAAFVADAAHSAGTYYLLSGISANTYFISDIIRNGTTSDIFKVNGGNTVEGTTYVPIIDMKFRIIPNTNTGSKITSDWVLVRPYYYPEPTHSSYLVAPVANFTANQTTGTSPLNVSFNDTSTGTPTSWNWSFGDGNYSNSQNITHLFYTGNWSVNLSATNAAGTGYKNGTWVNVTAGVVIPDANFTVNASTGIQPLSVQFNDTSTNTPTSWFYDFGDGNNTTDQNPVHVYSTGNWSVNMSATNAAGTDWKNGTYINVTSGVVAPVATFSTNATLGKIPLSIQFNDTSLNTPTSWLWQWDDGTANGTTQNPVHTFTVAGTYHVNLTATNSAGSNLSVDTTITAQALTPPVANFTKNVSSGKVPLSVAFTDSSTNTPTSWLWQWGDGTANGTTQNMTHQFTAVGIYQVNLTATNDDGSNLSANQAVTVNALIPPVANFAGNITTGYPGAYILFTDSSTESPTSWQWSFGDLTANATTQNPVHQYSNIGTYTVILTAFNADGNNTFARVNYITISAVPTPPTAAFSANATTGIVPKNISFTDASTNSPTSWNWTFGDGNTSTDQNPYHVYVLAGTYDVKLQVTNSDGSDWENKTGYLTFTAPPTPTPTPTPAMVAPIASFGCNRTYVYDPVPSGCQFYDNSLNNPTSWLWNFGDGNTSTERNPNHTFQPGYYTVTLTSSNAFGSSTDTQKDYIHIRTSYARTTVGPTHTITPVSTNAYNVMIESFGANRSPTTEEEARINWTKMLAGVTYTYTDLMGALFFVLLFACIFVPLWLMQQDLTIPGILGIILGGFAFIFIPSEWHLAVITFVALSIVAVIYGLMKDRG